MKNVLSLFLVALFSIALVTVAYGGDVSEITKMAEQGDAKSLKTLQRIAANGSTEAQFNLGVMFEQGLGVEKDPDTAKEWFEKAAEGGNLEAKKKLEN